MNASYVELLGNLPPPDILDGYPNANSFSVSSSGEIAILCADGCIQLANLRNREDADAQELELVGISREQLARFSVIEWDSEGSMLLLWSACAVGVVEMPAAQPFSGRSDLRCNYTEVFSAEMSETSTVSGYGTGNGYGSHPVAKASFHPLSAHQVVILCERGALRLVDLRGMDSQVIPLPTERFVGFAFGNGEGWLKFSLLLLAHSGDVYSLCPVVPPGCVLTRAEVTDLWEWADLVEVENEHIGGAGGAVAYADATRALLLAEFGPRPHLDGGGDLALSCANGFAGFVRSGGELGMGESSGLANYIPAVRGPLNLQRPFGRTSASSASAWREGAGESNSASRGGGSKGATDICTMGGAPVLAIAYEGGEVDFLVLDAQQNISGGGAGGGGGGRGLQTSSLIGPSWLSIDLSLPSLVCSSAALLVAETVELSGLLPPASTSSSVSTATSAPWRLLSDPVVGHHLHATCPARCESFLISCTWLERFLDAARTANALTMVLTQPQAQTQVQRGEGWGGGLSAGQQADLRAEVDPLGLGDADLDPLAHPSTCIPVFVLPPSAAARGAQESKESSKLVLAGAGGGASISGFAVLQDAMLGHVAMVRTTGGLASAVNLTVHAKLCELQDTLQGRGGQGQGLVPIREELGRATSADNVRWRHTKARLTTVAQGLRNMPSLDAATLASLTTGPSPQNKKVLLEAARKLEREVLVPLDELVQATTFSYELLEETYNSQMEILEGTDEADDSVGAGAEGDGPGLRMGLCRLITHLQGEQTGLAQRVGRIQERFGGQREQAEALLAIAVGRRAKLSRAQHLYRQQLADWSRLVSQMREQEAALRQASRPALHTQTAQAQASPQSPQINQPGWGTPASKTKTVSTPGSASTPYRPYTPGAMGGVGTSVGRVRAPPLYSIVGQGSAGTGSVSVASPSASGSAQFRSPVKTPSSAAARFGQLYSGGRPTGTAGSMGTLGTAGSSAQGTPSGVSASASASATPLGVRSPLFSSYRSARSIHSTSTAASAASTGALTGASMGGSAGRGREAWGLQGAQGMQGVQAPLQLTVEDQSACTQLLLSQADLLQAAQEQLAALERRLASLKAQSSR